jgi:hypothetical protein
VAEGASAASVSTPATVLAYMEEVRGKLHRLNSLLGANATAINRARPDFIPAWRTFRDHYLQWYSANTGYWSRFNMALAEVDGWANQLDSWQGDSNTLIASIRPGQLSLPSETTPTSQAGAETTEGKYIRWALWGAAGLGVLYIVLSQGPRALRSE